MKLPPSSVGGSSELPPWVGVEARTGIGLWAECFRFRERNTELVTETIEKEKLRTLTSKGRVRFLACCEPVDL